MIIAFNFTDSNNRNNKIHYNKFYDFLIAHGYKDQSIKCGPNMRIDTTERLILGYNIAEYTSHIRFKSFKIDKIVNIGKDNIYFNFKTEKLCSDFSNFLYSIGFERFFPYIGQNGVQVKNGKIVRITLIGFDIDTVNNTDVELPHDIIDLNLLDMTKIEKNEELMKLPTKEQILSAAEKYPQAESVLKELFPDVFPKDLSVTVTENYSDYICVRGCGNFKAKGFYLDSTYNWTIENDVGAQVVVPWKKS